MEAMKDDLEFLTSMLRLSKTPGHPPSMNTIFLELRKF